MAHLLRAHVITCTKCSVEKPDAEMKLRAGKPSKVCLSCDAEAKAERERIRQVVADAKNETRPRRKKRKSAAPRASAPKAAAALELTIPKSGFGCIVRVTDNFLQLTQENDEDEPDNVCLTRHEAKAIAEKFHEWIFADSK